MTNLTAEKIEEILDSRVEMYGLDGRRHFVYHPKHNHKIHQCLEAQLEIVKGDKVLVPVKPDERAVDIIFLALLKGNEPTSAYDLYREIIKTSTENEND